jgi:hypothetical protein
MKYFVTQMILSQHTFLLSPILTAFTASNYINLLHNHYCIRNRLNSVVCNSESMELQLSIIINWKKCVRKWSWSNLTYYLCTYLQILKKAARHISQNSRCSFQDSNSELPIYKPESLPLGSTCK